ncbi:MULTISPECIES: ABC transporter permease [unclassified Imperialibacter]|uniref:ABC transporter permease n=1 Tax=unclassified Imperialibacter TaxID=2629706 RepID=UPI001256B548|nr:MULTISPECIES: ABC transporter permease [unclassified Imperialibacter]CAD5251509.1 ABC transporter permease [Imperialibacter sp. 75]CAD5266125.1 ABC transporter permease [Imperialibacter sp. 89]VVT23637.1 ABC transporter permease [Imperialibacter sp. EC-SDR9]
MRIILYLIQKEFLQIFRNKTNLPILFVMPVLQLIVLSYAADFEIKNLKVYWMDNDQSSASRQLYRDLTASGYFTIAGTGFDHAEAAAALDKNEADLVVEIPAGMEKKLVRKEPQQLQVIVNAIDGTKAGLANYYFGRILGDYNQREVAALQMRVVASGQPIARQVINVESSFWFNPELNYKTFMVPGILVLLVTMIGAFLSSMNIVREKEIGTIEQINVTPIQKYQFVIGKLLPFWLLGLMVLSIGLMVAKVVFNIPFVGSVGLIYAFSAVYLLLILGFGLLISTLTDTQQQAMFLAWFFLVVFILMGGLFTAIENMPGWAQTITLFNPIRYFIEFVRLVMLKGAGWQETRFFFAVIFGYAVLLNGLAILNYKKTA